MFDSSESHCVNGVRTSYRYMKCETILNMFIRKLLRLLSLNIYLRSLVTINIDLRIILFSVIDSVINPSVNTFPRTFCLSV